MKALVYLAAEVEQVAAMRMGHNTKALGHRQASQEIHV